MKLNDLSLDQVKREFGDRLITLNTGKAGLRAGIHVTAKEVPGDAPVMDFIASDDTIDRYNEKIQQSGWRTKNFCANPVIPDCHDYSSVVKILGRDLLPEAQQVTGNQLGARVEFATMNPLGNIAWKMAKAGFIKSMSVGFIPLEWENGVGKDMPDRIYTEQELLEKSLVVVPANPGATIGLALKSGAIERADLKSLADFLKQFCSETPEATPNGSASGHGIYDAQLLHLARTAKSLLAK
jgi:HK97 family phage prohead protease